MIDELPPMAVCGTRGCPNPHPATPWSDRPLARRVAARESRAQAGSVPAQSGVAPPTREALPAAPSRPAWLDRLQAKDMTGALR